MPQPQSQATFCDLQRNSEVKVKISVGSEMLGVEPRKFLWEARYVSGSVHVGKMCAAHWLNAEESSGVNCWFQHLFKKC